MIRKIKIFGLFGDRTISLKFEKDFKILVGENGTGKTHVLNTIYYLMSNNLNKLLEIDFYRIRIEYGENEKISFRKDDLKEYIENLNYSTLRPPLEVRRYLPMSQWDRISRMLKHNENIEIIYRTIENFFERFHSNKNVRNNRLLAVKNFIENYIEESKSLNENKVIIKLESFFRLFKNNEFIYLPTYRRIEKKLDQIISDEKVIEEIKDSSSLNNFGMKDTMDIIDETTQEVRNAFLKSYLQLNREMLKSLLNSEQNRKKIDVNFPPLKTTEIILNRLGDEISNDDRTKILNIVEKKDFKTHHYPILELLNKLVNIHDNLKGQEQLIDKFVKVTNKYLVDKKFEYDNNNVTVRLINTRTGKPVKTLEYLSSGEKQIVSLFVKIYLRKEKDFLMFFDEPELSLSIEWQKTLLSDILNSKKCKFLFATTHSPFIFNKSKLLEQTSDIYDMTTEY